MYVFIEQIWVSVCFYMVLGVFSRIIYAYTDGAMNADVLDYQQYKTGERLEGLIESICRYNRNVCFYGCNLSYTDDNNAKSLRPCKLIMMTFTMCLSESRFQRYDCSCGGGIYNFTNSVYYNVHSDRRGTRGTYFRS